MSMGVTPHPDAVEAIENSREKENCPYCPSCQSYNADADGPMLIINTKSAHEACPECWKKFETIVSGKQT